MSWEFWQIGVKVKLLRLSASEQFAVQGRQAFARQAR